MSDFPESEKAFLIRTDFSDDAAWQAILAAIREPAGPFKAQVAFISDPKNDGLGPGASDRFFRKVSTGASSSSLIKPRCPAPTTRSSS